MELWHLFFFFFWWRALHLHLGPLSGESIILVRKTGSCLVLKKKKGELESWIFKTAVISLCSFFP